MFDITKIFSSGVDKVVDSVGNAIDKLVTSDAERLELKNQLEQIKVAQKENMSKMFLEDKASAREREIAINRSQNASWLSKNTSSILALITTLLTFALFYVILFMPNIEPINRDIIIYILGVLSAIVTNIFGFYFGSSEGQKEMEIENINRR